MYATDDHSPPQYLLREYFQKQFKLRLQNETTRPKKHEHDNIFKCKFKTVQYVLLVLKFSFYTFLLHSTFILFFIYFVFLFYYFTNSSNSTTGNTEIISPVCPSPV